MDLNLSDAKMLTSWFFYLSRVATSWFLTALLMINLDDKVKVAKIAKVREKVSDGNQELSDEEVTNSETQDNDSDSLEE